MADRFANVNQGLIVKKYFVIEDAATRHDKTRLSRGSRVSGQK